MKRPDLHLRLIVLGLLILSVAWPALAADTRGVPADLMLNVPPRTQVTRLVIPAVDRQAVAAEDAVADLDGGAVRFALRWAVDLTPDTAGQWETLATGERLWRLRVRCPEALSLNLGFSRFDLAPGARLQIYAVDGDGPVLGFDAADTRSHGQLWTPVLLTGDILLELRVPAGAWDASRLHLTAIDRGYRFFGAPDSDKAGDCNIDVVCPEGDGWRNEIATVGVYSKSGPTGSFYCTGALINNTSRDRRPLFLTAFHCGVNETVAPSVVVYWNYQSVNCGDQSGGRTDQFTLGSTLLADRYESDFALLELDSQPDPVFGVKYAGWDRTSRDPAWAVAIHHPSTDEKSISFEDDPLTTTSYGQDAGPGDGTHLRVEDWDAGTTEPGSSGSPLFNESRLVVGQLHGGFASCIAARPDWYGRLSVSWSAGTTPRTRLREWLDHRGTGVTTLALLDPEDPVEPEPEGGPIEILNVSPRPTKDIVTVVFHLNKDQRVHARVMNVRGAAVADLGTQDLEEGDRQLSWNGLGADGRRVPSGLYLLRLTSTDGEATTRLILIH